MLSLGNDYAVAKVEHFHIVSAISGRSIEYGSKHEFCTYW